MMTGDLFPTMAIQVSGVKLKHGETPKGICYVREKNLFFGGAKVIEVLRLASAFHENWDWDYAQSLLKTFKLNPDKNPPAVTGNGVFGRKHYRSGQPGPDYRI